MMIRRIARIAACVAAAASAPAAAQQAPVAEVYELNRVEIAPRPLNAAEMAAALNATYPAALKAAGVSGTVRVSMIVGTDGVPRDARVLESADSAFNAPTLAAVQTLRFSPAELNDRPVNVRVELPVRWQPEAAAAPASRPAPPALAGPDAQGVWELAQVARQPSARNTQDLARAMQDWYPQLLERSRGESGRVQVRFIVERDGTVSNLTILRSSDPVFNDPTLRSVSRLRFRPALVDGQPVRVWVELPIQWDMAN